VFQVVECPSIWHLKVAWAESVVENLAVGSSKVEVTCSSGALVTSFDEALDFDEIEFIVTEQAPSKSAKGRAGKRIVEARKGWRID
jgi:hypothetical protein